MGQDLNMHFTIFLSAIFLSSLLGGAEGAASCKIGNGSVTLPMITIQIPVKSSEEDCLEACNINRVNWQAMATELNKELSEHVISLDSNCPRRGRGSPHLGNSDGMKLLRLFLGQSPVHSYGQWFMTVYIPGLCKLFCSRDDTSITISSLTWTWGNSLSDDDLFIVCHTGYQASTNLCNDGRGLSFFQSKQRTYKDICRLRSRISASNDLLSILKNLRSL